MSSFVRWLGMCQCYIWDNFKVMADIFFSVWCIEHLSSTRAGCVFVCGVQVCWEGVFEVSSSVALWEMSLYLQLWLRYIPPTRYTSQVNSLPLLNYFWLFFPH